MPAGSYYYPPKDQWNMLDHFFYGQKLKDGKDLEINLASFEIYLPQFALKEVSKRTGTDDEKDHKVFMAPKRFEPNESTKEKMGFSDHFAIALKLDFPDPAPVVAVPVKDKAPEKKKKDKKKK